MIIKNADGTVESYDFDDSTGVMHVKKTQVVGDAIDANKRAYNDAGAYKSEVMNHKAFIPDVVWEEWCRSKGIPFREFYANPKILKRFLNDPDNKFCLTRPNINKINTRH